MRIECYIIYLVMYVFCLYCEQSNFFEVTLANSIVVSAAANLRSLKVKHSNLLETERITEQKVLQLEKQIKQCAQNKNKLSDCLYIDMMHACVCAFCIINYVLCNNM